MLCEVDEVEPLYSAGSSQLNVSSQIIAKIVRFTPGALHYTLLNEALEMPAFRRPCTFTCTGQAHRFLRQRMYVLNKKHCPVLYFSK